MDYQLTDERLAWLSIQDRLNRKAGRWRVLSAIFSAMGGRRYYVRRNGQVLDTGDRAKMRSSARMAVYSIAVDDVARDLSVEERRVLREQRVLPDWFLPRVEERYRSILAEERRRR